MDFDANLQNCLNSDVVEIRQLDTTDRNDAKIIAELFTIPQPKSPCLEAMLVTVARKMGQQTDRNVFKEFLAAISQQPPLTGEAKQEIEKAIIRGGYRPAIAHIYFTALRHSRIDIRPYLQEKIIENWSFTHPRDANADTWHYYLYLIHLKHPGAFAAIEKKIATTDDGNDVLILLSSLYQAQSEATTAIFQQYKHDQRRADTGDGPGLRIAEMVEIYLQTM